MAEAVGEGGGGGCDRGCFCMSQEPEPSAARVPPWRFAVVAATGDSVVNEEALRSRSSAMIVVVVTGVSVRPGAAEVRVVAAAASSVVRPSAASFVCGALSCGKSNIQTIANAMKIVIGDDALDNGLAAQTNLRR